MIALDYYSGSLLAGAAIAAISLILIIYSSSRDEFKSSWIYLNLTSAMWSAGYFWMITAGSKSSAVLADFLLHAAAIIIPYAYFQVVTRITNTEHRYIDGLRMTLAVLILMEICNFSPLFVQDTVPNFGFAYLPVAGPLYIFFTAYFFGIIGYAFWILIKEHAKSTDRLYRLRMRYFLLASMFGFAGGGGVFFMTFGIPIKPYLISIYPLYPLIITFAATRVGMFETKLLTAEIFTFTLILFAFARIIFANTLFDQIVSILLFVISLGIGILLVRTIRKEYETRERAQALANELATINQELDRMNNQKSEFLSIATHQLRTPLAAINGYTALLLDNSFGAISDTVRQTLQKVLQAEQLMNETIEDFLSVSRIDQGRMVYDMTVFDIRKLVTEVVDELTPATKLKNLTLTSDLGQEALHVNADFGKMKHVIGNLVDNAIKYTPSGFIKITVRKNAQSARVEISDSGVGIPADEIDKLFDKFVRARGASGVNVSGTGLGLYVAKQMVEAHKGRVWAESPGEGKGSTFIAEIPLSSM